MFYAEKLLNKIFNANEISALSREAEECNT
jgi:hypothetical protein